MSGHSFQYARAADVHDARIQASKPGAVVLAGGTDLLQLWKSGASSPATVVDISRLPLDDVEFVDGRLSLGATARLSDVAAHPDVTRYHPLIAEAILVQRQRADTQHGDGRRQSVAANALPVFSQRAACLQQAKARQRMWRTFRRKPPCGSVRYKLVMRRDARLGPGRCAGGAGRRGRGVRGRRASGASRCAISTGCPVRRRSMKRTWHRANSSPAFTFRTQRALPAARPI